jgi:hypothetical protein
MLFCAGVAAVLRHGPRKKKRPHFAALRHEILRRGAKKMPPCSGGTNVTG